MGTSAELIGLLHQIRNATSPLHRMKLAALAWRTLRGLSPIDRLAVARAIGVEGAERLVEQLGDRSGVSPSLLLSAIQSAEEAEPEELQRLLGRLQDPATRDDAVQQLAGDAAGWLGGNLGEETAEDGPDWSDAQRTAGRTPLAPAPAAASPVPPASTEADDPPAPAAALPVRAAPVPPLVPEPAPPLPRALVQRPAPAPGSRSAPTMPSRPGRRPAPEEGRSPARRPPSRQPGTLPGIVAELESTPSLFRRLRLLAGRASELAGIGAGGAAAVARAFPAGWSRRRAIEALIRGDAVVGTEQLLSLLSPEDDETTRMWLLTALAARSNLEPGSLEAAAADAAPLLRRRLAVRARRRR